MSKIAVVTGGIGGLGTAMCKALIEQGRRAVAVDYIGLKHEAVERWQADRKAAPASKSLRRSKRKLDRSKYWSTTPALPVMPCSTR